MKFAFYGLWDDERAKLDELTEKYGFERVVTSDVIDGNNVRLAQGCDGVSILGKCRVDDEIAAGLRAGGVRFLSTRTVGYNHIDLAALKKRGIRLCNSQYPPDSVAEFTLMLILMSLRKYKQSLWLQQVNDYSLEFLKGGVLGCRTVGVVGTGHIGGKVVQLLSGFGCKILCYSDVKNPAVEEMAEYVDLPVLYRECDILTFHVPLLPDTRHMVDRRALEQMKDGVFLVNTARGELFDTEALIEGIESRKIGALAMDVFENEDGIYHVDRTDDIIRNRRMAYLRQFPNVVLTQHMAFYTQMSMDSMISCAVEGLVAFAQNGKCLTEIRF